MIEIVEGDVFLSGANIIAHQVNCKGAMGKGIAKTIAEKYPLVKKEYQRICFVPDDKVLLGTCQIVNVENNYYIANLFGQYNYGANRNVVYTDLDALRKSMATLADFIKKKDLSLAIPYKIGCDLAGGDWDKVYPMICEVFKDTKTKIYQIKNLKYLR